MKIFYFLFLLGLIVSCTSDNSIETETEAETEKEEVPEEVIDSLSIPKSQFAGEVSIFVEEEIQPGVVLVNDAMANRVYFMKKADSEILFEYELPYGIGNDAELMKNGNLLAALIDPDPAYKFGGYGGKIAIFNPSNEILWSYDYSDDINLAHHDLEMLPNGNILFLAWEKKNEEDIKIAGFSGDDGVVYAEKLLEINPETNEIAWEWNSWDHLIQDYDQNAQNYGNVASHPQLIDLNYSDYLKDGNYNGDIFHANGLEYDESKDIIYLSVNFFSEVWVLDHSTTTSEAKSNSGGDYGKGGNLLYRFGNPAAYKNNQGERFLYHNHHPNLVEGTGNLLIFANGIPAFDAHSVVYELKLPEVFDLKSDQNNEPEVIWQFSNPDLFSAKVSGSQRLQNGNTLITQGTSGYWEVDESGKVVWRFEGEGFFWRGYHYNLDSPALKDFTFRP